VKNARILVKNERTKRPKKFKREFKCVEKGKKVGLDPHQSDQIGRAGPESREGEVLSKGVPDCN